MRQLGGMDASFLYMETPETPMHVGGVYLFDLPRGYDGDFYEDFKAHMTKRLHLAPMFGKKLAPMPFELDHPVWVDDDVDLDYHIRRVGLAKPGGMVQLEELVGRLHSNFLDRSRPLWEFYVIDGFSTGQAVLYMKVHHAAVDGGAGMAMTKAIYDTTPVPRDVEKAPPKASAQTGEPGLLNLLGAAYTSLLRQQVRTLQAIPDAWKALAKIALPDSGSANLLAPQQPLTAPKTILNGTITSQRVFAARSIPLADAKRIGKASGAKLNDVVLAICSAALRRYLIEKNALPDQSLTAFVPVSLREAGNTEMNNQVTGMICSLATDIEDPLERIKAIVDSSARAKQLTGSVKDIMPRDYSMFGAPLLIQGMVAMYGRSKLADQMPLAANVTISNVPGPTYPLYLAGAEMMTMYPVSIPAHGQALNLTVQSYKGMLDFGLTSCRRIVPDVRTLGDYIVDAFDELNTLVAGIDVPDTQSAATTESSSGAASKVPSKTKAPSVRKAPAAPARKKPSPEKASAGSAAKSAGPGKTPGAPVKKAATPTKKGATPPPAGRAASKPSASRVRS